MRNIRGAGVGIGEGAGIGTKVGSGIGASEGSGVGTDVGAGCSKKFNAFLIKQKRGVPHWGPPTAESTLLTSYGTSYCMTLYSHSFFGTSIGTKLGMESVPVAEGVLAPMSALAVLRVSNRLK